MMGGGVHFIGQSFQPFSLFFKGLRGASQLIGGDNGGGRHSATHVFAAFTSKLFYFKAQKWGCVAVNCRVFLRLSKKGFNRP